MEQIVWLQGTHFTTPTESDAMEHCYYVFISLLFFKSGMGDVTIIPFFDQQK